MKIMKTAISIPGPVFENAKQLAQKMDMSLSELYTAALSTYVADYQNKDVTEKLNEVYEKEPSELDTELIALQVVSIGDESW